jgi:hypothetical protein
MSMMNGQFEQPSKLRRQRSHSNSYFHGVGIQNVPKVCLNSDEFSLFVEALKKAWQEVNGESDYPETSLQSQIMARSIAGFLLTAVKSYETMDGDGLAHAAVVYYRNGQLLPMESGPALEDRAPPMSSGRP